MSNKIDKVKNQIDGQEKYYRHICILIHGIPENTYEITGKYVVKIAVEEL